MIETARSADATMQVTLGEVNRNVLALRADFKDHLDKHDSTARWQATTAISLLTAIVAVVALVIDQAPK